jgi:hypothetical protein
VNSPTPALVTQRGARRLPRWPCCCCARLPAAGLFGRDPWRNADLTAFGQMVAMAEGRTAWLAPTLGGVPADTALLPHWLGAGLHRCCRRCSTPAAGRAPALCAAAGGRWC